MTRKHIRSQKRKAKVIEQLTDAYLLGHHVFLGHELTTSFIFSRLIPEYGDMSPRQYIFQWHEANREYRPGKLIQPDEAKKLIDDNWYRRTYKHKASIS